MSLLNLILFILLAASPAHAYETDSDFGYIDVFKTVLGLKKRPLPPPHDTVRLQKFKLALDTIGIPAEPAPDFADFPNANTLTQNEIAARLAYIDPDKALRRYLSLSLNNLSLFRDFFSAVIPTPLLEYSLDLGSSSAPHDSENLIAHLKQISNQVKDGLNPLPLSGLKIVIDPGHMGTDFWDEKTGKFVEVNGEKVSEGKINLWTAYLVANELEGLGANVILTRTEDGPVSRNNYQTFNATPSIYQYFYDSLDDWMPKYLSLSDSAIKKTIKQKTEVRKAFLSSQRDEFFIGDEDLGARSKIIDEEQPDIVLDIHYDASDSYHTQTHSNSLEAFVPGGFLANETGSRLIKSFALKHLLDARRYDASIDLASEVVQAMSASEGVSIQRSPEFANGFKIKDGVYARNLYITRRNLSALMVYLECLHYDYAPEFKNLSNPTEIGSYHGIQFIYPPRIKAVAEGITTGLLNYFKK